MLFYESVKGISQTSTNIKNVNHRRNHRRRRAEAHLQPQPHRKRSQDTAKHGSLLEALHAQHQPVNEQPRHRHHNRSSQEGVPQAPDPLPPLTLGAGHHRRIHHLLPTFALKCASSFALNKHVFFYFRPSANVFQASQA